MRNKNKFHEEFNVKIWDSVAWEGSKVDEFQKGRRREKCVGKQKLGD